MLQQLWKPEASVAVDDIQIELGDCQWPNPLETEDCCDEHQLSLSLSPRPRHSQVVHDVGRREHFEDVGDLVFFPATVPYRGRSVGGHQRLLICRFGRERFASVRGDDSWSEAEFKAGLDVRDAAIRATLDRLVSELRAPGFASSLLAEALMTTVMIDLARVLKRSPPAADHRTGGGLKSWQLRRVTERIQSVSEPPPTIAELADLCSISPRHLMRSYKLVTGSTLHRHVEEARLQRAKDLLISSDLPIKTIAWQLGFTHPGSFSIAFQRKAGQTPRAFRSEHGRGEHGRGEYRRRA